MLTTPIKAGLIYRRRDGQFTKTLNSEFSKSNTEFFVPTNRNYSPEVRDEPTRRVGADGRVWRAFDSSSDLIAGPLAGAPEAFFSSDFLEWYEDIQSFSTPILNNSNFAKIDEWISENKQLEIFENGVWVRETHVNVLLKILRNVISDIKDIRVFTNEIRVNFVCKRENFEPAINKSYFLPVFNDPKKMCAEYFWSDSVKDRMLLSKGLIFANSDSAKAFVTNIIKALSNKKIYE